MRVRVKYSKQGIMKFIGHLDMMRFFQKALRRAGIDVVFTEGMSPHMSMSFALPLGVGMTSDSEYVDVDVHALPVESAVLCENTGFRNLNHERSEFSENQISVSQGLRLMIERLNQTAPEGVHFLEASQIQETKACKGMNLVQKADYTLCFREQYQWEAGWREAFAEWMEQDTITVVKKSKHAEKEINIRPFIYEADLQPENGDLLLGLSAGNDNNIRPELVMQAFAEATGRAYSPFTFMVNRDEVFADYGKDGVHQFVPLIRAGEILAE